MLLKIGELAKRTGLTVRTLHHYDNIGLLTPSVRSEAGYRLYDRADIARLHRIQALRRLDLPLAEISALLTGDGADLQLVIQQQIASIERQLAQAADLRDRLKSLTAQLADKNEPNLDEWLVTLEMMAMHHKYFSHDEIQALRRRKKESQLNAQWPGLVAEVRGLMDRNIPPGSEEAQALATRWLTLSAQTMGDDPRFYAKLSAMHRTEFSVQALTGVDGPLLDFIMLASFEIRCRLYAQYVSPEELEHYRINYPKKSMHAWMALFGETRQKMEQGIAPEHPDAQVLFHRWAGLFKDTWGNDPATRDKVRAAHKAEPRLLMGSGINQEMQAYIDRGFAYLASNSTSK